MFVKYKVYNFEYYTLFDITMFLISGVLNIVSNQMLSYAYKLEEVSKLAPYSYVGPVFTCAWDMIFFGYSLTFTDWFGAIMVIFFLLNWIYL